MATIVTRSGKGSALTHNEVDANFNNLNNDKLETSAAYVHPTGAGNNHIPTGGSADQVLTYASSGTAAWADAGGAFAASTVTVTGDVTLTAGQSGNLIRVTASSTKTINLPATATGLFYVFSSESAEDMYIKPNGSNSIDGNAGVKLNLTAGASGIISCGTAGTNWSTVGITRNMIVHRATTFYNSASPGANPTRLTGTYTPTLGTQILICVGSATSGAPYGSANTGTYRSAGSGGQSYGEKFISSPASSYAYGIAGGGNVVGPSSASKDKTTTAGGITATQGAEGTTEGSGNTSGLAGGTCSGGTVNFTGGTGGAGGNSNITGGGGGAATRAGNGGTGNGSNNTATFGGGTGGNNASTSAVGAAATARNNSTYDIPYSTSETYLAGNAQPNASSSNNPGNSPLGYGAGPKTLVNFGSVSFTIADNDALLVGGQRGANYGGYSKAGIGGYVTFVEFI